VRRVLWSIVFVSVLFARVQAGEADKTRSLPDVVAIILHDTGRSGSLSYGWKCVGSEDFSDPFRASIPPSEGTAVQRLHAAFANKPSLRVTEDSSGLVRVVGGTFKTDLLDLKIKRIVFHNEGDAMKALSSILGSPELDTYIKANNIIILPEMGGIYPTPSESSPQSRRREREHQTFRSP
jgi:hypothetical protein